MITHIRTIANRKGKSHEYRITQIENGSCDEFIVYNMDTKAMYQTTLDHCSCPSNERHPDGSDHCKHIQAVRMVWLDWLKERPPVGIAWMKEAHQCQS